MTDKPTIVQALASVMEDVRNVGKGDFHNSPTAKFHFRGIDAVVNAVGPALRKHQVVVTPQLVSVDRRDVQTSGGKASRETCVVVKYVWTGPDSSTLETIVPGEAMDNGDKGTAKAMSVAFRIALLQALCLPTDDADPDTHHYERESAPVGRGEQPRNGAPPAQRPPKQRTGSVNNPPPSETAGPPRNAVEARQLLAATCDENDWDRGLVAARFAADNNMELGDCTDRDMIVRFRASLFSVSDSELRGAPAEAGTRQ